MTGRQGLPVVLSQPRLQVHRAALNTRHNGEGFTTGLDHPKAFLLRGKKNFWHLGSVTLSSEAESPAKGLGEGGSPAILVRYCTKLKVPDLH